MKNKIKIAGVTVLYNPKKEVVRNIKSYMQELDILFLVDNSTEVDKLIIKKIKEIDEKIIYIPFDKNYGIARALNISIEKAKKLGYNWILTMDQDSYFNKEKLEKFVNFYKKNDYYRNIGIISAKHKTNVESIKFIEGITIDNELKQIQTTMTSGNILNIEAWEKIGRFKEELFIDYVDHEYCLRLIVNGYKVMERQDVYLEHSLGEIKKYKLGYFSFSATNHNYIRRYYITRNRFFVINLYKNEFKKFCKTEKIAFFKELLKILLVETDKIRKVRNIIKGIIDYKNENMGEYNE